jgi:hypothetical protein
MKSPMNQRPDADARDLTEKFIAKNTRGAKPAAAAVSMAAPKGATTTAK